MKENKPEIDMDVLRLMKYEMPSLKRKLCTAENIFEASKLLDEMDKVILIYENMLENALLLQTILPQENLNIAETFFEQAKEFYKGFVKPYFKQFKEIQLIEQKKLEKLEEFMKDFSVDLND